MDGFAIGEVVASKAPGFGSGDVVEGLIGWQDYAVLTAADVVKRDAQYSHEMLVGPLGITGLTAYYGMIDVARVRPGETVLVSGAAGAVGSIAGQTARIAGCRVVGTAGGHEKCAWLKHELGFDAAVDHKCDNVRHALREVCPDGIDVFFDNTGGAVLEAALALMNLYGRVACCGNVSQYDVGRPAPGPVAVPGSLITKRLRMEGFIVTDHFRTRAKAEATLADWVERGLLKACNDIVDGLENVESLSASHGR